MRSARAQEASTVNAPRSSVAPTRTAHTHPTEHTVHMLTSTVHAAADSEFIAKKKKISSAVLRPAVFCRHLRAAQATEGVARVPARAAW